MRIFLILAAVLAAEMLIVSSVRRFHVELYVNESDILNQKQRYSEARELAARAARKNPRNGYALFFMGMNEFLLNQHRDAASDLEKAVRYMPHLPNALRLLGQCYFYLDQYDPARETLESFFRMDPNPRVTPDLMRRLRALSLYRSRHYGEAVTELAKADVFDSPAFRTEVLQSRIVNAVLLNQIMMADYLYRRFQFILPSARISPPEFLAGAMTANKLPTLIRFFETVRLRGNADASALKALGLGYVRTQRLDEAITVLNQASHLAPNDSEIPLFLGDVHAMRKDLAQARKSYGEHFRLDQKSPYRAQIARNLESLTSAALGTSPETGNSTAPL